MNEVAAFIIGAGGLLTQTSPASFSTGATSTPVGITIDPAGQFLYIANSGSTNVSGFAIGLGGILAPITPPIFSTAPHAPIGIATPGRP